MKQNIQRKSAFTLIEILTVVAIIGVVAAMLFPMIRDGNAQARAVKCLSQLRQIGTAARLYANEHDGTLPVTVHQRRQGGKSWSLTIQEYAGKQILFKCPDDEDKGRAYTYLINDFLTPNPAGAPELDFSKTSRLESPAQTFMFAEASKGYTGSDHFHFSEFIGGRVPASSVEQQIAVERHTGKSNFIFADCHAEALAWERVKELLVTPGSKFIDPTAEQ